MKSLQTERQTEDVHQAISKTHLSFQFREALNFDPISNGNDHITTHISPHMYGGQTLQ